MASAVVPTGDDLVLPLHAEQLSLARRRRVGDTVRASAVTRQHEQAIEETLTHERVEVDRIPIGREVDAVPPVRQVGDTTIMSIVEETIVVERRLILVEEVHIRRRLVTEQHRQSVMLRRQEAVVTRLAPDIDFIHHLEETQT